QPVRRGPDDPGGGLAVDDEQAVIARHAEAGQGFVHVVGVVDRRAQVGATAGIVVDADDDGPDPTGRGDAGVARVPQGGGGRRRRRGGGVEGGGRRGDGRVTGNGPTGVGRRVV